MAIFNRFRRPRPNTTVKNTMSNPNSKLSVNVQTYVNGYVNARNSNNPNAIIPMNSQLISNLKNYINKKRPKVAGATAAAVKNVGGSNNVAARAGNAAAAAPSSATPGNVGNRAANAAANAGAGPTVQAAAAAGAAKNHALAIGAPPPVANAEASNAAANAAANATNNPNTAARAAATGAAAANVPKNQQNAAAVNAANNVQPAPTRANLLRQAATQQAPRQATPGMEKTIKAPNGRNITVVRANNKARWNFKNANNASKYNLNNRNGNTPKIRNVNVNTGNLFKQGN